MCCWSLTDPNPIIVYFVAVQYILRLLTVNVKNFLTPKIRKCATTFWYLYWKCNPIIVNPVVKMWPIQRHMPISLVQGSIPPPPHPHECLSVGYWFIGWMAIRHFQKLDSAIHLAWENGWHFVMPLLLSLQNDIWGMSREIPYWRDVTTQIWVVLFWLGENLLQQIKALLKSG